jgi:hypothetical protein
VENPQNGPIGDRAFNINRSKHFLRTLFQHYTRRQLRGNLILNAGGNHNSHIAAWIADGTIEEKAGHPASYVRLRAPAYQE